MNLKIGNQPTNVLVTEYIHQYRGENANIRDSSAIQTMQIKMIRCPFFLQSSIVTLATKNWVHLCDNYNTQLGGTYFSRATAISWKPWAEILFLSHITVLLRK